MSCWFAIPSCRPADEARACFDRWRARGYRIAVLRQGEAVEADLHIHTGSYLGWARSTNILARLICRIDPDMQFCIGGGDDYQPDPDAKPAIVAHECYLHFGGTFGVMQPTGDRLGDSPASRARYGEDRGAIIDRIAGSPWMGREWIERAYLGNGPMWDGYHHLYADQELCEVAEMMGRYQRRIDLTQFHDHWGREGDISKMPEFLAAINSQRSWSEHQMLYETRAAKRFPGHEPLSR
jgi:hypothetical protein